MYKESERRPGSDPLLEQLIDTLSTEHRFDIRGYKRSTLYRRIRKRMSDVGCTDLRDYMARLGTDCHEYAQLIKTILINVTEFFRDPESWEYLKEECLKPLVKRRGPRESIRVWSVGCASGEEPYSIAITLAELLGEHSLSDLKVYATDVDEGALAVARSATYTPDDLRSVERTRRERFFDELPGGRYAVRRELRSSVIFGRHDVLADAPIARLDLLVCRNLLIYFDNDTQHEILSQFHSAVRDEGYLFLGTAETPLTRSVLFSPVEPRFRIFQAIRSAG